jgi:hypothetical protein
MIGFPKILILISILNICSACSNKPPDKEASLVISDARKTVDRNEPPPPPLSPYEYYGSFNFIFDTTGTIYFYKYSSNRKIPPKRVIDFDSYNPVFINLNPNNITIIPEEAIGSFAKQNILKADIPYRTVRVIGLTDTIKSKNLLQLIEFLKDSSNNISYIVRQITFEEIQVLEHMKNQQNYNPKDIVWDTTKVWFDNKEAE